MSISIGTWVRSAKLRVGKHDWDKHYSGSLYELYGFLRLWAVLGRDGLQSAASHPALFFDHEFDRTDERALAVAVVDASLAHQVGRGWYGTFEADRAKAGAPA